MALAVPIPSGTGLNGFFLGPPQGGPDSLPIGYSVGYTGNEYAAMLHLSMGTLYVLNNGSLMFQVSDLNLPSPVSVPEPILSVILIPNSQSSGGENLYYALGASGAFYAIVDNGGSNPTFVFVAQSGLKNPIGMQLVFYTLANGTPASAFLLYGGGGQAFLFGNANTLGSQLSSLSPPPPSNDIVAVSCMGVNDTVLTTINGVSSTAPTPYAGRVSTAGFSDGAFGLIVPGPEFVPLLLTPSPGDDTLMQAYGA